MIGFEAVGLVVFELVKVLFFVLATVLFDVFDKEETVPEVALVILETGLATFFAMITGNAVGSGGIGCEDGFFALRPGSFEGIFEFSLFILMNFSLCEVLGQTTFKGFACIPLSSNDQ